MVTYHVMERTTTCSPIIGQCFDTMIAASSDKDRLQWPIEILVLETVLSHLNTISIFCFLQTRLFTEIFSRTGIIHQGIFRGRALSIRAFSVDGHHLNNRVFLSRNYRLIVAPRKFDVLKTNICPRSFDMLVLRTSNFQGATIRPIVSRHKPLYCLYCSPLNFLPHANSKIN